MLYTYHSPSFISQKLQTGLPLALLK